MKLEHARRSFWYGRLAAMGALVALVTVARPAHADPATDRMRSDLHVYFDGESGEGLVFMGVGTAALFGGSVAFAQNTELWRGVSYPVLAVGLIELAAGVVVYGRTRSQVEGLDAMLASDPSKLRASERKRMAGVNREFKILEIVEIALAAGGAAIATYGFVSNRDTWKGVGVGLGGQALTMLTFDFFAARRADVYTEALDRYEPPAR